MNREDFLNPPPKPVTKELLLQDGRTVHVRKLSQSEVEVIRKKYSTSETALEGFRYVVSRCLVTAEGERVLKDEDHAALLKIDFDVVQEIATEVVDWSGLNKNAKKA